MGFGLVYPKQFTVDKYYELLAVQAVRLKADRVAFCRYHRASF
jgi:hypothetical protein